MSALAARAPWLCSVLALCAWRAAPAAEPVKQVPVAKEATADSEFLEFLGGNDDVDDADWWDFLASGPAPQPQKPRAPDEDDSPDEGGSNE
jgi:hypothetical protein